MYLISPLLHSSKSSIISSQAPPVTPPPAWHHQQHPHRVVGHTGNLHLTDGVIGFFQKKITSATDIEADLPLSISTSWKKEDETAFTASPPLPCKFTLTDENRVYQIKSNAIDQLSVDSPNATYKLEWDLKNKFDFSEILADALMQRMRIFLEENNSDNLGTGEIHYWGLKKNGPSGKSLDEEQAVSQELCVPELEPRSFHRYSAFVHLVWRVLGR